MILKQLTEARYVGSEPIDEFYALYDLDKKRFIKENKSQAQSVFQRAQGIRTTDLFNTKQAADTKLQEFKDRCDRGIDHYTENPYGQSDSEKRLRKLTQLRQYLEAVRVVKITATMTVS